MLVEIIPVLSCSRLGRPTHIPDNIHSAPDSSELGIFDQVLHNRYPTADDPLPVPLYRNINRNRLWREQSFLKRSLGKNRLQGSESIGVLTANTIKLLTRIITKIASEYGQEIAWKI